MKRIVLLFTALPIGTIAGLLACAVAVAGISLQLLVVVLDASSDRLIGLTRACHEALRDA